MELRGKQLPHKSFPFPEGCWSNLDCFVVGAGPSLSGFEWRKLEGRRWIGINKQWLHFPTIGFSADYRFMDWSYKRDDFVNSRAKFPCVYRPCSPGYDRWDYAWTLTSCGKRWGNSFSDGLVRAVDSTLAAINFAWLLGARPIYLLGVDMKGVAGHSANDEKVYPDDWKTKDSVYVHMLKPYRDLVPDEVAAQVINLNPDSGVERFRKVKAEEVLH